MTAFQGWLLFVLFVSVAMIDHRLYKMLKSKNKLNEEHILLRIELGKIAEEVQLLRKHLVK
jgi:hypothetical protein